MTVRSDDGLYPIGPVSERTGVHPVTLRAWERRHGLLQPRRTEGGRRLYTEDDIDRIHRIVSLLGQGIPVSRVAAALENPHDVDTAAPFAYYQRRMLAAVQAFDDDGLDRAYNDALSLYPVQMVFERITTPALRTLGDQWQDDEAGIAREHFFSTYLRHKVGARLNHVNRHARGARILAACPSGEYHELGLIQFALAAASRGYRVVLTGANLPAAQIAAAARLAGCVAVALSVSRRAEPGPLVTCLRELVADFPVLVGGEGVDRWREAISATGAVAAGEGLEQAFAALDDLANET